MGSEEMFAAQRRFDASCGEAWKSFIDFSGLYHIQEIVSTDEMLCPSVIEKLRDADWMHNIQEDYRIFFFNNFEYLKARIDYDLQLHNLLRIVEQPNSHAEPDQDFEFCGYDIIDSYFAISVLTNCGGFPGIFNASEVNRHGLLSDLGRAEEIASTIRIANPDDPHCFDCHVWAISRYIGPS